MNLRLFVLAAMALQPTAMLADPLKVAKPDFAALGLGSEWEAEGRN